jgi:hypothetical protein
MKLLIMKKIISTIILTTLLIVNIPEAVFANEG